MSDPSFTLGIEEEYLLVRSDSLDLAEAPEGLVEDCAAALEGQVSPEFLQCQIEVGTRVCADVGAARDDLRRLRSVVAAKAAQHGLSVIAVSCHPFGEWTAQHHTNKARYNALDRDLAGVARRMLICGMHVHVGLGDDTLRIDTMRQMSYFLPHLLALSTSSPYWRGEDTGLASYRLTIFDNLPRTGLPPQFAAWEDYARSVGVLTDLGIIEDASKIWWDLRPSVRFPTLEARIMDVQPRLEHTLALAAVVQSVARLLWRLRRLNQRWRIYEPFLIAENRWRAQRYGVEAGLIDFGAGAIKPFSQLLDELIELVEEDATALGCLAELETLRDVLATGTSSSRQRAVAEAARAAGADGDAQMRAVVAHLIEEFHADL
jgi:carboxylate-amine ligase